MASGISTVVEHTWTPKLMQILKTLWIIIWALIGAVGGALWLGGFTSLWLSILGGVLGMIVCIFAAKYAKWYEWIDF